MRVLGSPAVTRTLKTALVILMLALVPIRAVAAVTTGFCAFAHEHGTPAHHASQAHGSHEHDAPSHSHDTSPCSSCAEHCSSAFFTTSAAPITLFTAPSAQPRVLQERFAAGFVPDHLDPPPLVL